jgi:hypothetical protein
MRHVRLNSAAVAAFQILRQRSLAGVGPVFVTINGEPLHGYKHWFDPAAIGGITRRKPTATKARRVDAARSILHA